MNMFVHINKPLFGEYMIFPFEKCKSTADL
jgi:hypothetical protein